MRWALLALGIGSCVFAAVPSRAEEVPEAPGAETRAIVRTFVPFELLEDPDGALSIEDVVSGPRAADFRRPERVVPNLGLSSSAWWLRFRRPSVEGGSGAEAMVGVSSALVDEATLYVPRSDGTFSARVSGRSVALAERDVPYRHPVFRVPTEADESAPFHLRLRGAGTMIVPLEWFSPEGFGTKRREENLLIGGFFGVLLMMATFGALAYAFLREATFLWYAAMVASFALWQASSEGILSAHLWSGATAWIARALHLFGLLFGTCAIVFSRFYLATPERLPVLDRWITRPGWVAVLLLGLWTLLVPGPMLVRAVVVVTVAAASWAVLASIVSLRRGYRPARYFVIAWLIGCVAAIAQALRAVGWLPSNLFTDFGLQVAVLFTFVTLSLGVVDRMLGMAGDLRRGEEEIRRLEREDAAKRTLLATASHDLRQPLHAVGLLLGALRPRLDDRESISLLDKVQSATREMANMFNALLDMSRLDAGLVRAQPAAVALSPLLRRLADEFALQASQQGLEFSASTADVVVRTDPVLLSRILRNLLTNALRYTRQGRIDLLAEVAAREVCLTVADTGPGIPLEAQRQVFEPFRRAADRGASPEDALGLGLAIVRRLADLLGHRVELESIPGQGTRIGIRMERSDLSASAVAEGGLAEGAETSAESGARMPDGPSSVAGRALVVDDDPTVRSGMSAQLSAWGYDVATAASRAEALDVVGGHPPDVVLADHHLADGESGVAVVEALRGRFGRDLPALIVSGDTSAEMAEEVRARGLSLLTKPVPPSRLRRALEYARRRGAAGA